MSQQEIQCLLFFVVYILWLQWMQILLCLAVDGIVYGIAAELNYNKNFIDNTLWST